MKNIGWVCLALVVCCGCKEVYNAPVQSPATGYLVVEGFINSSNQGITTILLSRTAKLQDTVKNIAEQFASVAIEGDGNDQYPLSENQAGVYSSSPLTLNSNEKYRLHIRTTDGKEYMSEFSQVQSTPLIDSVSWQNQNGGVQVYINTHDPLNNVKYYQWKYEETWEIHSAYTSSIKFKRDPQTGLITGLELRNPLGIDDQTIFRCWQSGMSTSILLGSTEKLNKNQIFLPMVFIPQSDTKISVLYSINVKQYALSKAAYQFLEQLKKNTEQLGSIFDAQPSTLNGNIHCTTNNAEIVIGYVEVSQEQQQRLFINNRQLPDWNYSSGCDPQVELVNNNDSLNIKAGNLLPTEPNKTFGNTIITILAGQPSCVDCTLRGTNVKPPFWP